VKHQFPVCKRSHTSGRRLSLGVVFLLVVAHAHAAHAAGLAVDTLVTTNQSTGARTIVSPAFSTTGSNELLVAFVNSDGPTASGAQTFSGLSGGGVTWQLRRRTNVQYGTSEIWQAVAPQPLSAVKITATRLTGSYQGSITVVAFNGADTTASGATGSGNATSGAPSAALTTTRAGAWVWGAGSDWDRAVARTVAPGQTKVAEYLAPTGDTFWVQRQTNPTPAAGTVETLADTAPTNDRWNLSSIEILPAGTDTQPPTAPTGLKADSIAPNRVDFSWTASSDDYGVAGYRVYRDGQQVGSVTTTAFSDSTALPGSSYAYTVRAYDAAGLLSASSAVLTVTTPAPDTTPPSVSISAPAAGATVAGTITVRADAADDVGVAGVQFLLDGHALGNEDTTAPFTVAWDSTAATNSSHALSARARDSSGNPATSADVAVTVNNGGSDPAQVGQWGPLVPLPAVAIHSALTPTGRILLFQGTFTQGGSQYEFDPLTGSVTALADAAANLFCAAQAVLADGRVDVAGGTDTSSLSGGKLGLADNTAYNWKTRGWTTLAPMHYPRWYATATTLADGKVLVTSGANKTSTDIVPIPELYSPTSNTWKELTAASRSIPYYSFVFQLPDGRIIRLGASEEPTPTETLDLNTNQWSTVDGRALDGGSAVNYAPGKFLKAGTASDGGFTGQSASTAYTLDMTQSGASWQPTSSMSFKRSFLNLTNLPDGTVLATGGGTDKSAQIDANGVLPAEDWDPATGSWMRYAAMSAPRLYHSVAVLLPDGRVYVAGGGSDNGVTDQKSAQIFSPPYLFKGARPTISSAPATVHYGATAFVGTPDAGSIVRASLIRTGSVTHAFDQNARAVPLEFTQTVGGLDVKMPANGNLAPPGYYLLFIVNNQGVPSVAPFVRFPAPYEDAQAPSAPANLTATGQLGAAALSWTAAADDVGVVRYDIHRSTTAGFTPSAANKIGESTTTTYTDSGVSAGDYYYRVTAEDAAGNVGPASNEAQATVQADTTRPSQPTGLSGSTTSRSATLSWTAATDNVGVSGYRVYRDGAEVGTTPTTSYTDSGLTPATGYAYTVAAYDAAGNLSSVSAAANVTTAAADALALDTVVSTHQSSNGTSISSPPLSTSRPGELLVAFVTSDGPSGAGGVSFSSVVGGGLTWRLRQRTNTQAGTAEIWQAAAPSTLGSAVVTATRSGGAWQGAMTVAAFTGADTATLGAVASANAATGAPRVSLTTTRANSWVWGVGIDWDKATARTLGAGQALVDQYFSPGGDTYWTQRRDAPTPSAGSSVTLDDMAPATDRWNLSAVEVLPAGP
jgi:chitodextrinase